MLSKWMCGNKLAMRVVASVGGNDGTRGCRRSTRQMDIGRTL